MLSRIMNVDPVQEVRSMEEIFNRMFGQPFGAVSRSAQVSTLPVDIFERDNNLVIRAAAPGVKPEELDVSIENNVLTIRGEARNQFEEGDQNTKFYHREVSYGMFSRSIRLPEKLEFDKADAEFEHGFVTITIPKLIEQKPEPKKLNVRTAQPGASVTVERTNGKSEEKKASVK